MIDPNEMPYIVKIHNIEIPAGNYIVNGKEECIPHRILIDLAPTSQWRDISSAPKDGTTVMLWCEYDDEPQIAKFRNNKWEIRANGQHAVSYMSDFGTDYHYADNLTHWQPITPPTKDLADAGKEKS